MRSFYPKAVSILIENYSKLPGIGKKSAERLAVFTINKLSTEDVNDFAKSLLSVKSDIFNCVECGFMTDVDPCPICKDDTRDKSKLIVVEESKDVIAIEKIGMFEGYYHVLNGALAPLNGIGIEDINLVSLLERLKDEAIQELIICTNASVEGESTAMYINKVLEKTNITITRIAHGIPAGADIDYADETTLLRALEGRRKFN